MWLLVISFWAVVETFDNAAGKLAAGYELVEDQLAFVAKRAGDLLHEFDLASPCSCASSVEELAGEGLRGVVPGLADRRCIEVFRELLVVLSK